jgi:hypothetical protein
LRATPGSSISHRLRDAPAVLARDQPRRAEDVLGLLAEHAGARDHRLDLDRVGAGERSGVGPAPEQLGRDGVHHLVGRLRRQDGRDQELKRRLKVELAVGVGVELVQPGDDRLDPPGIGATRPPRALRRAPFGGAARGRTLRALSGSRHER